MIEPRAAAGVPPNPHGQQLANVSIIMCALAGVTVIARLCVRIFMQRNTGWDDYTLIASLALAIGMTICFNYEVYYGMGLHTHELDAANKVKAFLWLWVAQLLYKFANGMTKISLVLLYLRIFPSRIFKMISWGVIAFVICYCTAAVCTSIWQCDPIEKAWRKTLPGHCIKIGILWYVNSVFTLLADLMLIILPMNQIVRLKLPLSQKIGLAFVFSLGIFVMACTIIRCVALGPTVSQNDSVYYQAKSNSWTFLEVDVSIICAALPILKAPLSKLFPRLWGNRTTAAETGASGSGRVSHGGHNIGMKSYGDSQIRSGHRHSRNLTNNNDPESDEEGMLDSKGIRKTTNITFDYEEGESMKGSEKRGVGAFDFELNQDISRSR
ncbi:uncharacterized protein A1O9_09471 [Exophiala aquamarina CBS 119918]|uniref:Rhodopsin domain-containing protein n=1 Tax=Exophiala aquamarina CBS 119918 TaxID=1182545 RepID=A0A072PFK4_9EURO|nr:uncharacterized protein A1O9_09471 [Exophiala aquamarina CBS 119918]KEF54305.1 hypothetical protein A1O9_09471 [Exophiala aquamarina CBS 119918]